MNCQTIFALVQRQTGDVFDSHDAQLKRAFDEFSSLQVLEIAVLCIVL